MSKLLTGDPASCDSSLSNKSVLLQLISCGGSASFRAMKTVPVVRQQPPCTAARKSTTGSSLHKGVLCKTAATAAAAAAEDQEEDADMISCMSENPRFGNLQAEEKEYFSGSIVEERVRQVEPIGLKRSNSYTEERFGYAKTPRIKISLVAPLLCYPVRLGRSGTASSPQFLTPGSLLNDQNCSSCRMSTT